MIKRLLGHPHFFVILQNLFWRLLHRVMLPEKSPSSESLQASIVCQVFFCWACEAILFLQPQAVSLVQKAFSSPYKNSLSAFVTLI